MENKDKNLKHIVVNEANLRTSDLGPRTPKQLGYSFPPEWAKHEATWLSWPHKEESWPGKIETIYEPYCQFIKAVAKGEKLADRIAAPKADGSNDDSLFAYIVEKLFPTGWLASDDGSMEFADFVHIDPETHKVTLIHAKGSNKEDASRGVSVSSYEIVVSQAVKNIRFLDRTNLAKVLGAGAHKKIAGAVWFDGKKQPDRKGIIAFAKTISADHDREVIVLQPQLTETEHEACTGLEPAASNGRVLRMKQLDTLMLAARLSCSAVGATFSGIGAA